MEDMLYLFTSHHTGTHFARMLLETHPQISVCVDLARHIGASLDPSYVTANRAWTPNNDPNELALREALLKVCRGDSTTYFKRCMDCYLTGYMMNTPGVPFRETNNALLERARQLEFREDYGIDIFPKHPSYYFFHGHCDMAFAELKIPRKIRTVTTVRHPLSAILSSLKRGEVDTIPHQLFAFEYFQNMPECFKLCVDLWNGKPAELLRVFDSLGLTPAHASVAFASLSPRVNRTIRPDQAKPHHNYDVRRNLDKALDEAEVMLAQGKLHEVLRPYWDDLRKKNLLPGFEKLGYDFAGL